VKKIHVVVIALLLALAAVFGTMAATRSAHLGAATRSANDAAYRARVRHLNAYEARLRRELAATPSTARRAAPRTIYRRPPAIVVVRHTHHGDDGHQHEAEGGGGD
jgi:hypothetical protein